ncbi:helix-turn-helix transcriptional regulator [Streptomyces sp. NPDC004311]|uniref:helix-turn-helix transcriptional regulator n=1 Tax=Streptomyces sp. NPDC004311 TaxID=3364698 RepID=UPI003699AC53
MNVAEARVVCALGPERTESADDATCLAGGRVDFSAGAHDAALGLEAVTASLPQRSARRPKATAQDVAAYLGVPVPTLYQWRHARKGPPAVRVGRHLRYDWDDVEAWWAAEKTRQNQ